jgi:hypothetical protein
MDIHLYMSCYRSEALIASQLAPEAFGRYMAIGTQKLTRGSYMFFEVDRNLKSDYFRLHDVAERCVPHPDGAPKASKYVSVYRVLEHIPRAALGRLYLVTADGRVLGLDQAAYEEHEHEGINLYQELCPLSPMVVSVTAPASFARFMTSRDTPLCVPRLLFADLLLDRDLDGHLAGHLPYLDPLHIEACIEQVQGPGGKRTKTISRNPQINAFYRTVRRGFFVADEAGMAFYPYPVLSRLETQHAHWWRSAQLS